MKFFLRKILKKKKIAGPKFTCEICRNTKSSKKKFRNKERCYDRICRVCIAKHIQVQVEQLRVAQVQCPGRYCDVILDPIFCRRIIAHQVFDQWCHNLCYSAIIGLGYDKCYCPFPYCSELILNECGESNVKKTKCPNCKKKFCFQCKIKWHSGYQCEESGQLRDENDILFDRLEKKKKWARCPGCGHCVARYSGCFNIECRCTTTFCYSCGEQLRRCGACGCR